MKKYSFPIIAVLLAIASAFTFKPAFDTFRYDGDNSVATERKDRTEYSLVSPGCGPSNTSLCAIIAAKAGDNLPVIPSQLEADLFNGGSSVGPDFSNSDIIGKNP